MSGPKNLVSAPRFDARQYGLLSVVQPRYDEPDSHWRNGVIWQDICGAGSSTYDPFCLASGTGTTPAAKTDNIDWNTYGATPFTAFAQVDCSPVGYSQEEQRARAVDALTRTEAFQVERAFWTGAAGGDSAIVFPHLAANEALTEFQQGAISPVVQLQCAASTVSGTTILDVTEGLGRLEMAFGQCYQGQGVIHAPLALAESFFDHHVVDISGGQVRTRAGNLVAFGTGYTGSGPDGTIPSNAVWVYMTGPVFAYRSQPETFAFKEMFNRSTNTLQSIVERTYVLGYSCCCMPAVPISLGGDVTGQPLSAF